MTKINQEEYEVLKELDDKWKWIARDSHQSSTFGNEVWIYETMPNKLEEYWHVIGSDTEEIDGDLFQFIRWSDEEPYNIAELIEEYEHSLNKATPWTPNPNDFNESEETEVKKDIEWLKEVVSNHLFHEKYSSTRGEMTTVEALEVMAKAIDQLGEPETTIHDAYDKLKEVSPLTEKSFDYYWNAINDGVELDEPEALSQEFINEKAVEVYADTADAEVHAVFRMRDLQDLLVPKQEITEEQAYDKIAETFPATAKEVESVLEKYYSGMPIEFSEELHGSIMRAFDVEATSKTVEALTGMTLEQIAEEARNGGIVPKQAELEARIQELIETYKQEEDAYSNPENGWISGFIEDLKSLVEEEQKYNVKFKVRSSFGTVGIFLYKEGDEVLVGDNFRSYYPKKAESMLTEQEIRDFQNGDILFENFAVPVEELEE